VGWGVGEGGGVGALTFSSLWSCNTGPGTTGPQYIGKLAMNYEIYTYGN
jgi:hypothetical protein